MTNKIKLTKTSVEGLPKPATGQAFYWDTETRGFGVRVSAGGAKSYIVERRVGRKTRRVTIGRTDDITVANARRDADAKIGQLASGLDPAAQKVRNDARLITIKNAFEIYIKAPKSKGVGVRTPKKPLTIRDIEKAMRRFEDWHEIPLTELTGKMVINRHADMTTKSPAQANLAFRYLRAAINEVMANHDDEDDPIIKRNPVDRLSRRNRKLWAEEKRATGHIPDNQISAWLDAVHNNLGGISLDNEKRDALIFMLLTGARFSEVLGNAKVGYPALEWRDVDFMKKTVLFRNTKNRMEHELPLSTQILTLLEQRKEISGKTYVFSDRKNNVPSDLRTAYEKIAEASGVRVTAHDLRRTFSTIASRLDISTYKLKRLINHISSDERGERDGGSTAGYIQITTDDLRDAMQRISDYIISPERREQVDILEVQT